MTSHHEVERAYAVGPDDVLPDLSALDGVAQRRPSRGRDPRRDVRRHRRPGAGARRRHAASAHAAVTTRAGTSRCPPATAATRCTARSARRADGSPRPGAHGHRPGPVAAAWLPVAEIETVRTTRLLLAEDGTTLAEVADDAVVGTPADGAPAIAWRELEVELVTATPHLLDAADDLLAAASDIHPSREQRKIGTVLADRLAAFPAGPDPDPDGPAGPVLHDRLVEHGRRAAAARLRRTPRRRRRRPPAAGDLPPAARGAGDLPAAGRPRGHRPGARRAAAGWPAPWATAATPRSMHDLLRDLVADLPRDQVARPRDAAASTAPTPSGCAPPTSTRSRCSTPRATCGCSTGSSALVTDPPWTDVAAEPADTVLRERVVARLARLRDAGRARPRARGRR